MTIGWLFWTSEHFVFQIVLALICVHQIEVLLQVLTQAGETYKQSLIQIDHFLFRNQRSGCSVVWACLAKFCATGVLGMRAPGRNCTTGGGDSRPEGLKATFGFG